MQGGHDERGSPFYRCFFLAQTTVAYEGPHAQYAVVNAHRTNERDIDAVRWTLPHPTGYRHLFHVKSDFPSACRGDRLSDLCGSPRVASRREAADKWPRSFVIQYPTKTNQLVAGTDISLTPPSFPGLEDMDPVSDGRTTGNVAHPTFIASRTYTHIRRCSTSRR